jgi:hypothetical protein
MRSTGSSPGGAGGGRPVLVRYRLIGGPVSVDQRITVFDDGAVELDERHRSRAPTWLRLEAAEMDRLRAALEEIPAQRWSVLPRLLLARVKSGIAVFLGANEWETSGTHFELKRNGRRLAGETPMTFEVATAVQLLDSLRVHAVRLHPR